jgi:hypothetical protein
MKFFCKLLTLWLIFISPCYSEFRDKGSVTPEKNSKLIDDFEKFDMAYKAQVLELKRLESVQKQTKMIDNINQYQLKDLHKCDTLIRDELLSIAREYAREQKTKDSGDLTNAAAEFNIQKLDEIEKQFNLAAKINKPELIKK